MIFWILLRNLFQSKLKKKVNSLSGTLDLFFFLYGYFYNLVFILFYLLILGLYYILIYFLWDCLGLKTDFVFPFFFDRFFFQYHH